jgi:hypothetical protein
MSKMHWRECRNFLEMPLTSCERLGQAWYAQLFDACVAMQLNFGVYGATCHIHTQRAHKL